MPTLRCTTDSSPMRPVAPYVAHGCSSFAPCNGDNPPLVLQGFQFTHPVTRILFKAGARDQLYLYYGHDQATRPHYDLTLMGRQVLQAERKAASLGIENRLGAEPWQTTAPLTGLKGALFWAVLLLVVAGLLIIVIRLLPRKAE